ncbi:MAG TPA: selenoneine synthase SenA [Stellaceae bacterium]|nr:selenoneine synthase SenA [Stellaceae bacterium]
MTSSLPSADLVDMLRDSRRRTLALVAGLTPEQLIGPRLDIVNPLLWEIGHVAWFHEHFILRHLDERPLFLADADALYDSSAVAHDRRWQLPLPSLDGTLDYMAKIEQALIARLKSEHAGPEESYLYQLTSFHEDMHDEAFVYSRQTLAYPEPGLPDRARPADAEAGPWPGDVEVPGGTWRLGSAPNAGFVFDNEKWVHPVVLQPFRIARAPVTNAEFAAFIEEGGYRERRFWSDEGWRWRESADAQAPVYWRRADDGRWAVRRFARIEPLAPHQPVIHVNWYEADAWCRWAGRRLATEAEWEAAAAGPHAAKTKFPWGDEPAMRRHANLDGFALGPVDVAACAAGDSAWGCRQMIGNVWEWTASRFVPFPGFSADIYRDYSEPWFGTRKVLRGGAWATRARMITSAYRNFFTPERRDIFAGFRTVAL